MARTYQPSKPSWEEEEEEEDLDKKAREIADRALSGVQPGPPVFNTAAFMPPGVGMPLEKSPEFVSKTLDAIGAAIPSREEIARRRAHEAGTLDRMEAEQLGALGMPIPKGMDPRAPMADPLDISPSLGSAGETSKEIPSRIGYRNGVFTNIGIEDTPEEEDAYAKAVATWRGQAGMEQANRHLMETLGLATPPSERPPSITGAGTSRPRRDFEVNMASPYPGMKGYPEGGHVSQPYMADPTKPVSEVDWKSMSPLAKDSYLGEVGAIASATGQQAEGVQKAAEAQALADPNFPVERRMALWNTFVERGKNSLITQSRLEAWTNDWLAKNEGKTQNSPEFAQARDAALMVFISQYLKEEYPNYAPWDDVLLRSQGLMSY